MSTPSAAARSLSEAPRGAFSRVALVLLALARMDAPRVADIGAFTGLPTSAVYRCLATLLDAGLAEEGPVHGRYHAGAMALPLAERYRRNALGGGRTTRVLAELSAQTQELGALLVRSGDALVCVDAIDGPRALRCSYAIGEAIPMTAGASAKAVLSRLPDGTSTETLLRNGLSPSAAVELLASLPGIRERGFAVSAGEVDEGVWGVSAPVLSHGAVIGAVSTMAPLTRSAPLAARAARATVAAAQALSRLDLSLRPEPADRQGGRR